ncbi:hypothetical protein KC350_g62 [Hortaea werneckii]|nr:hypothetical protein KC350_g62 [Hortaea werneckii]
MSAYILRRDDVARWNQQSLDTLPSKQIQSSHTYKEIADIVDAAATGTDCHKGHIQDAPPNELQKETDDEVRERRGRSAPTPRRSCPRLGSRLCGGFKVGRSKGQSI